MAKLVDPFQFHWRDQNPMVEETPPLTSTGKQFVAAARAKEEAWAARRGSLIEVRRAQAVKAAKVPGPRQSAAAEYALRGALERHRANVVAHKAAVAKLKELTPKDPLELHESPFSIETPRKPGMPPTGARTYLSPDKVEKELLEKHGVDPAHIGFISNRPFANKSGAYYKHGQNPESAGFNPQHFRTREAFKRGLYDPTSEALIRQHASNQGIVDQGFASRAQVKDYFGNREQAAKLLENALRGPKHSAETRARVGQLVNELRAPGDTFFKAHSGTAAWDHAQHAAAEIKHLTGLDLVPGRIAHPYAPAEQLDAIAKHTVESIHDRLDPHVWEEDRGNSRFPTDPQQQHDAGTVGLVHRAVAKQMDQ